MSADRPRYLAAGLREVPDDDGWLTSPEADRLGAMRYPKRRSEARLGRWTAKRALALALGHEVDGASLTRLVIRNAADGAPEVFVDGDRAPVGISMTDRADWGVCVVVDGLVDVGCDLEVVEARSQRFVDDWFTDTERALLAGRHDEHDLLANLVWSAKESALKVLRTGLRRDTRSVEVHLGADRVDGWSSLTVVTAEGERFSGWWCRFGNFLLTFASRAPLGPPESLVDPPPLASAVPTHSWMS